MWDVKEARGRRRSAQVRLTEHTPPRRAGGAAAERTESIHQLSQRPVRTCPFDRTEDQTHSSVKRAGSSTNCSLVCNAQTNAKVLRCGQRNPLRTTNDSCIWHCGTCKSSTQLNWGRSATENAQSLRIPSQVEDTPTDPGNNSKRACVWPLTQQN